MPLLHRDEILAGIYQPVPVGDIQIFGPVDQAALGLERHPLFEIISDQNGEKVCDVRYTESFAARSTPAPLSPVWLI